jgi:hypothetical protein
MDKNDSKPKSNRFYQCGIDEIMIRAITLNHAILAKFCGRNGIIFISIKYYKRLYKHYYIYYPDLSLGITPGETQESRRTNMKTSYLSAGIIVKSFAVVAARLLVGESAFVTHYGTVLEINRTGDGKYDLTARIASQIVDHK